MKIVNLTRLTQQIDVRHADQRLDRVQLMPRRKLDLGPGLTVDRRWLEQNPQVIEIHGESK